MTYIPNKTILGQKVLATSKQQWNNVLDGRRPAMDSSLGQPPNVDSDAMSWRKPPVAKFFCHFYDYKNCLDKSRCCMKRNVHAMCNLCIQMTNQLFNLTLFMQSYKQVSTYMFYDIICWLQMKITIFNLIFLSAKKEEIGQVEIRLASL